MDEIEQWMDRTFGSETKSEAKSLTKTEKKFHRRRKNTSEGSRQKSGGSSLINPNSQHKTRKPHPGKPNKPRPQQAQKRAPQPRVQARPHGKPTTSRPKQNPPQKTQATKPQTPALKTPAPRKSPPTQILRGKLKIIPLGGLDEVGKNMMAFEYEDDIIIIDMGLEFPSEELFGIDYVIPDVSYLEENKKRIRGVLLTHGHLDHIGGIPYILPKLDFPPVYGTKLTIALVEKRIEEFNQQKLAKLHVIDPKDALRLGKFLCTFFRVTHSIPDGVGVVIDSPVGKIVHTGDFKFDENPPLHFQRAETRKMAELGNQNVLALFSDSTNALKPGHSLSGREVDKALDEAIGEVTGRLIVTTFASQIGRLQQIVNNALKHKRKVFVSGRSMQTNIEIAQRLGYLKAPKDAIRDIKKYTPDVPDSQTLIITTGSQGEAVSALSRIAQDDHSQIKLKKGDTIILSSSPIIGNERAIATLVNRLCMRGATVIHNQLKDVHASGHGYQEELKRMIKLIRPKFFLPIHGEYFMRKEHAKLAHEQCGIKKENIIMLQNGDVLLAEKGSTGPQSGQVRKADETVETKYILIDGRGEGQMDSQVQLDRRIMSENGALMVLIYISRKTKKIQRKPDVISRGFIYMTETNEITQEVAQLAEKAYRTIHSKNPGARRQEVKKYIRQTIDKHTHKTLERRPLIVPIIVEW